MYFKSLLLAALVATFAVFLSSDEKFMRLLVSTGKYICTALQTYVHFRLPRVAFVQAGNGPALRLVDYELEPQLEGLHITLRVAASTGRWWDLLLTFTFVLAF